jgi:hypothetical protein
MKMTGAIVSAGLILLIGHVFAAEDVMPSSSSPAWSLDDKSNDSWDTNNYREAPETRGYYENQNDSFDTNNYREAPEDGSRLEIPRGYYGTPERDDDETNQDYDPAIDVGTNADKS